jgi:polyvinyl alcohol dehydrogenase (cytochrome)
MLLKVVTSFLAVSLIASVSFVCAASGQSVTEAALAVDWASTVNCTVTGSRLQKTSGLNDTSDAAARSRQSITSGDGFAEFTATETDKLRFCGLTHSPIGTDYADIDFAIKLTDFGVAEVRENNLYKAETPYRTGDIFRINIDGGIVRYAKNGFVFQTSLKSLGYPLVVQAAFISLGGSIENTVLGAGSMRDIAEWSTYQHDSAHTGYCIESSLDRAGISKLKENWRFDTGGMVTGTPIVSGGTVYVGSWDGFMYALRESTGEQLWKFNAGTLRVDPCDATYGIDNTAALSDGKLFFAGANCDLYALNPATGGVIWKTQLADPLNAFHAFSSPVVFDGKLYIGLASHCVKPCVRGRVVCVDISNGRILWSFIAAPENSTGGGVWSSVAVDGKRRLVYVGTGNFCTGDDTYSNALVALNADTGALAWSFKRLVRDALNLDFGASPVLLDINGTPALVIGSKDGHCYALNRATGQLIWDVVVTDASAVGGIISSPAAAYGLVFMGSSVNWNANGKVVALDQRDGHIVWEATQSRQVMGATAVTGGAVFIGGVDGNLRAYDTRNGAVLWSAEMGSIFGGVAVSQDRVFVGSADKSVRAFKLPSGTDLPPSAPTVQLLTPNTTVKLTGGSVYTISWSVTGTGVQRQDLSLSRDGGQTWQEIATGLPANATSYEWTVPNVKTRSGRVRVSEFVDGREATQDQSDADFVIKKKKKATE